MCFSASASFSASAVLLTLGTVALTKSSTSSQKLLACIPVFFCVQQFTEGLLWLGLTHPEFLFLKKPATYVFLVFAQVVWPTVVPLSVRLLEVQPERKKMLSVLLGCGMIISSFLLYCLIFYKVDTNIGCYHINYDLFFPKMPGRLAGISYFIPTVIPPLVSGNKKLRAMGVIILLSYFITQAFYRDYLISVWCFFAAVISLVIVYVIISLNRVKPTRFLSIGT